MGACTVQDSLGSIYSEDAPDPPLGSYRRSHLGEISCTMAGRWMVGHESLCLSLNISCSFSRESVWFTAACLSSATFRSCCSFDSCLGSERQKGGVKVTAGVKRTHQIQVEVNTRMVKLL